MSEFRNLVGLNSIILFFSTCNDYIKTYYKHWQTLLFHTLSCPRRKRERIHESMIGRVMSIIMFANNGLAPVSAAGAGWLITFSLEGTFLGTGFIMISLCLLGLLVPTIRRLGLTNENSPEPGPT